MKNFIFIGVVLTTLLLSSCDDRIPNETTFKVEPLISENHDNVEFIVTPMDDNATYIVGLMDEESIKNIGGDSEFRGYVNALVASTDNLKTYSGMSIHPYPELTKYINWYFYVAQVSGHTLIGDPVICGPTRLYNPYSEYLSEIWGVPVAISDNGLWIAGAANGNYSFIYDVLNGEGMTLEGGAFWDVSDKGVCYGQNIDSQKPVKYEDGVFSIISLPDGAQGDALAVSPDGSRFYGWCGADFAAFAPYVMENGSFKRLSMEGSTGISYIDDNTGETMHCKIIAACVRDCAANGAAAGYGLDDGPCREQSVIWKADGTFKVIGEGRMLWNFDWNISEYIFGGQHTVISPNGRYAASICTKYGEQIGNESSFPFLYDIEADQIIMPSDTDIADMGGMGVACVGNDGTIYLSGYGSPCLWRQDLGVLSLQLHLEDLYGEFGENIPDMQGSLADVSADGRTFVLYHDVQDPQPGTLTQIYTF